MAVASPSEQSRPPSRRRLKPVLITLGVLSVLAFLVYWAGIAAPKKALVFERELGKDRASGQAVPLYSIYYEWDGVRQVEPWWMVYYKLSEWKVLPVRRLPD